jgi:hypothetical protein
MREMLLQTALFLLEAAGNKRWFGRAGSSNATYEEEKMEPDQLNREKISRRRFLQNVVATGCLGALPTFWARH